MEATGRAAVWRRRTCLAASKDTFCLTARPREGVLRWVEGERREKCGSVRCRLSVRVRGDDVIDYLIYDLSPHLAFLRQHHLRVFKDSGIIIRGTLSQFVPLENIRLFREILIFFGFRTSKTERTQRLKESSLAFDRY